MAHKKATLLRTSDGRYVLHCPECGNCCVIENIDLRTQSDFREFHHVRAEVSPETNTPVDLA